MSESSQRTGPVAGILLAAGTSSRMGSNKMLFELHGESILRGAARRALAGGVSPLLVVLGHEADRARQELEGLPCQTALNMDYEQGINTSLKAGVAALMALSKDIRATVVMLSDMPFVTPEMIAGLIERYRSSTAPLVISDYEGVNAPPMLYDRSLFIELLTMTGRRMRAAGGQASPARGGGFGLARRGARRSGRAGRLRADETLT